MLLCRLGPHLQGLEVVMRGWRASALFGSCYAGLESICIVWMLLCGVGEHLNCLDVDFRGWRASVRF